MINVTRLPQLTGGFVWIGLVGFHSSYNSGGSFSSVWNDEKPKFPSEVAAQINELIAQGNGTTLTIESSVFLTYIDWDDEPMTIEVPLYAICTFPEFQFSPI